MAKTIAIILFILLVVYVAETFYVLIHRSRIDKRKYYLPKITHMIYIIQDINEVYPYCYKPGDILEYTDNINKKKKFYVINRFFEVQELSKLDIQYLELKYMIDLK